MDREKLIEVMKDTRANATWHRWGYEESADYLIANGVTIPKWIPVTERLPEPETDVLVFVHGCIDILTYRYNRRGNVCFMFRDECGYWKEAFCEVTHWMPLPEPPSGERRTDAD